MYVYYNVQMDTLNHIHVHLSPRSCAAHAVCVAINYTPLSMTYYAYDSTANF